MRKRLFSILTSLGVVGTALPLAQFAGNAAVNAADEYSGLVINEVCASNTSCLMAGSGDYPDWIELYNSSNSDIDLSGVGVSNGAKKKFKFKFDEDTVLSAGEYCIIFCDKTTATQGELHADFNIGASGETIYLTAPDESNIDTVVVPVLATDVTYGRHPDGSEALSRMTPTPGSSNNDAAIIIEAPLFSEEGGFYDSEFYLSLSDPYSNTILYTLDGSDPRTSDTAAEYSDVIRIYDNTNDQNVVSAYDDITLKNYSAPDYNVDKGIVVRAVCRDSSGSYSSVVTNNYFVNKTAAYYTGMRVIAISTDSENLFDGEKGIYAVGDKYYEWKNSSSFNPDLNIQSASNPTNYNQEGKEWERPCNIQVFENGQLKFTQDVGMRIAGNWTAFYPQKSLTLYSRSEYGQKKMKYDFFNGNATNSDGKIIKEYKKVTLRNGGQDNGICYFRDDLNQNLASGLSFGTQAKMPYIVFIDGEFWGYYSMQEKEDENYIESHFGVDSDNVTIVKIGALDEGNEGTYNSWVEFWNWMKNADMTEEANYQLVCDTIDIQGFIDYIAFENYIMNWDCLINPNNWRIWRADVTDANNQYADGKWRFLLYDTDLSTGRDPKRTYSIDCFANMDNSQKLGSISSLFAKLMENTDFKKSFYERYLEIAESNFDSEEVQNKIGSYQSDLTEAIVATNLRFGITQSFKNSVEVLRDFFNNRREYAINQLNSYCGAFALIIPDEMEIVNDDTENRIGQNYLEGAMIGIRVRDGYTAKNVMVNDTALTADANGVYTVTITSDTAVIANITASSAFSAYQLTLGDDLVFDFFTTEEDITDENSGDYTVRFTGKCVDKTGTLTKTAEGSWKASTHIYAKNINQPITAQLYKGEEPVGAPLTKSVSDYLNAVKAPLEAKLLNDPLNPSALTDAEQKLLGMITATQLFGNASDAYFGSTGITNEEVETKISDYASKLGTTTNKIFGAISADPEITFAAPFAKLSLVLDSKISVRVFSKDTAKGSVNDVTPEASAPEKAALGYSEFYEINGITPLYLSKKYTYTEDGTDYGFSALSWCQRIAARYLASSSSVELKDQNLAAAVYAYYMAAKDYSTLE